MVGNLGGVVVQALEEPTPRRFAPRVLCRQAGSKAVILPAIARATVVSDANARSPLHKAMNRATKGVTVHAQALARASGIGAANGCCTRSEDPALLTELAQKPSSAPAPLAESLRDLDALLLLFPCPATPDTMRHTHRVNACRRLVRRVVLTDSVVSSIRLRKPGSSTLLLLRANPRRRQAALGKARVRERPAVSAPSRGPSRGNPAHHPVNPGSDPECVVFAHSENALRIMPPIDG